MSIPDRLLPKDPGTGTELVDMFEFQPRLPTPRGASSNPRGAGMLVASIIIACANPARAEVHVEGDASAVRIETSQASIKEVIEAIGPLFKVRFRITTSLENVVDGVFTGTLEQVIPKVLAGYNYVIKKEPNSLEVLILGPRGAQAVAVEPRSNPAAESLAKRWRTPIAK